MKRLLIIIVFAVLGSTALFAQDQDQDRLMLWMVMFCKLETVIKYGYKTKLY
jgi:hypothetical protein